MPRRSPDTSSSHPFLQSDESAMNLEILEARLTDLIEPELHPYLGKVTDSTVSDLIFNETHIAKDFLGLGLAEINEFTLKLTKGTLPFRLRQGNISIPEGLNLKVEDDQIIFETESQIRNFVLALLVTKLKERAARGPVRKGRPKVSK